MVDVPETMLRERAQLGMDRWDEMWEGVLHMAPAPNWEHQSLGYKLVRFLGPLLENRGIEMRYETEVHEPGSSGSNYRIPDLLFLAPASDHLLTKRGIEGAPLAVVEIRSPEDETLDKLPFFARIGVAEVIVLCPWTRGAEIFRLAGRAYLATSADDEGRVHAASLDVRFSTRAGEPPVLRVECQGQVTEI